jgi:hypothetical protein
VAAVVVQSMEFVAEAVLVVLVVLVVEVPVLQLIKA